MRASFTPGIRRSPSPGAMDHQRSQGGQMNNQQLRYSHGGKPAGYADNLMRIPQPPQPAQETPRNLGAQVPGMGARNLRPSSEMLPVGQQSTPETEVIDKWFEDLQNYEATLEEMAAASLDQNFKEELSAIEQWFRVLSEAERTAALYSLLQESTQVQIRFFITVLQQMARSDPVGAFISPNQSNNAIGEQLEAKMASLGIKSPSSMKSATPGSRGFQRQSTGFLTPNSASLYGQGTPDASAALAAQRSKFKGSRTSAPGTFPMDSLHFSGSSTLDNVQEKPADSTPSRERSRSSEHGSVGRSPRASGPLDDSLSPMSVGGSWASMVNTPIMSMLDNNSNPRSDSAGDTNSKLDSAAAQLAQFAQQSDMGGANWSGNPASPQLTSPHFNIPTMSPNTLAGLQSPSGGMSNPTNLQMMNTMAAMGGLNNMNSTQLLALQQQILQQQQQLSGFGQQSRMPRAPQRGAGPVGSGAGGSIASTRSPNPNNRTAAGSPGAASSSLPGAEEEVADITVLNDVPAWLRHLRLHKYTPNFEGSNWREMVMMDDRALEEKGVAALGARRKMLKTFEAVRQKYGMEAPTSTKPTASSEGPQDGADE